MIRILVIVVFLGILASLGSALFHLSRGGVERTSEDSRKMARALTIRVGLSIALFLLLMLAWYTGLIQPHGIN
ncbi:MAG: twin transmembrane helix small protein [Gammaproteobacteria bacterium]